MAGLVNFFSPWWKGVPGACSGPKWPTLAHLEHPEKVLSFKKEAERGWKSGARSLSWKSDWKPSISRSFCAIGTYCIFFRLEVTAVWKKKCRYKQISFTKSLLLLKGHFQSSFIIPFQCSITYVIWDFWMFTISDTGNHSESYSPKPSKPRNIDPHNNVIFPVIKL